MAVPVKNAPSKSGFTKSTNVAAPAAKSGSQKSGFNKPAVVEAPKAEYVFLGLGSGIMDPETGYLKMKLRPSSIKEENMELYNQMLTMLQNGEDVYINAKPFDEGKGGGTATHSVFFSLKVN